MAVGRGGGSSTTRSDVRDTRNRKSAINAACAAMLPAVAPAARRTVTGAWSPNIEFVPDSHPDDAAGASRGDSCAIFGSRVGVLMVETLLNNSISRSGRIDTLRACKTTGISA